MTRKKHRAISGATGEALGLLADRIRAARLERRIPAREIAERAGISRDLLSRIERADPACGIGVVFEVATLLGVELFRYSGPRAGTGEGTARAPAAPGKASRAGGR